MKENFPLFQSGINFQTTSFPIGIWSWVQIDGSVLIYGGDNSLNNSLNNIPNSFSSLIISTLIKLHKELQFFIVKIWITT